MNMIVGVVLAIIGLIMTVWGGTKKSGYDYEIYQELERFSETRKIDAALAIGIIFLIIGIVLLALAYLKKTNGGSNTTVFKPTNGSNVNIGIPVRNNGRCAKCGAVMNGNMQFCPVCGQRK